MISAKNVIKDLCGVSISCFFLFIKILNIFGWKSQSIIWKFCGNCEKTSIVHIFLKTSIFHMSFLILNLIQLRYYHEILSTYRQGRETAKAFPLYTMGTERNFPFRSHCIQWERFYRFSSLLIEGNKIQLVVEGIGPPPIVGGDKE